MNDLLNKFLMESKGNRILYIKGVLNHDLSSFALLQRKFKNFVFQLYFVSYVKKSIAYKSIEFMEKKDSLYKRENLTLNTFNENFNEEIINTIPDNTINLTEMILSDELNFTEIFMDHNLLFILNNLTKRQQEVIKMLYVDEKSEIQVAEELKVSPQSINKVKNTALDKIKKQLGGVS